MSNQLVCQWKGGDVGIFEDQTRVVVDEVAGTVTFEHCHRPRRFWAMRTDPIYTCRLDEVQAVYLDWWAVVIFRTCLVHRRRDATISTPNGSAVINSRMAGFNEVVASLRSRVGPNRGSRLDNPNLWFVGILLVALILSTGGLVWSLGR